MQLNGLLKVTSVSGSMLEIKPATAMHMIRTQNFHWSEINSFAF
jgi:hypothetical protein